MTNRRPTKVPTEPPGAAEHDSRERLQKLLARAGLGSRRKCEELILEGRVEVDRRVVSTLGVKADPASQEIRVDGIALRRPKMVYYAVHKPQGVVSTNRDPAGRPRVVDLLPPTAENLFTVGRLDMSSEGLMLVTNDGELANRLAHPRYGVEKTYHVEVAGQLEPEDLEELRKGVHLAEGFARVVGARIKTHLKKSTLLEVVLNEGRNREIRRLLARVGHKVLRLRRIALGPLRLGELEPGAFRLLRREEVAALKAGTGARPKLRGHRRPGVPRGKTRSAGRPKRATPPAGPGQAAARRPTVIGADRSNAAPARPKPHRAKVAKPGLGQRG